MLERQDKGPQGATTLYVAVSLMPLHSSLLPHSRLLRSPFALLPLPCLACAGFVLLELRLSP